MEFLYDLYSTFFIYFLLILRMSNQGDVAKEEVPPSFHYFHRIVIHFGWECGSVNNPIYSAVFMGRIG